MSHPPCLMSRSPMSRKYSTCDLTEQEKPGRQLFRLSNKDGHECAERMRKWR